MSAAVKSNWSVIGSALLAAGLSYVAYRKYTNGKKSAGGDAKSAPNSKPTFVILQHSDTVPPAIVLEFLKSKGAVTRIVALERESIPAIADTDIVISLGGHHGAYEDDKYPFLAAEKELMRECVRRNIPLLGICLGAQLLADACGGKAFPSASFEGGYPNIKLTEAGKSDPVMSALLPPASTAPTNDVLVHHGDTFTLPKQATLLASTIYPHAFRLGSAFGVQFHPEATINELKLWSATPSSAARYASVGITAAGLVAEAESKAAAQRVASYRFFNAWWNALPPQYTK